MGMLCTCSVSANVMHMMGMLCTCSVSPNMMHVMGMLCTCSESPNMMHMMGTLLYLQRIPEHDAHDGHGGAAAKGQHQTKDDQKYVQGLGILELNIKSIE